MSKYLPANSDTATILKFGFEFMRIVCAALPPKFDSFNVLTDCANMGWSNFDMAVEKAGIPIGEAFIERCHMSYMFNYGVILNTIMTMMWPFIPANHKAKLKMLTLDALMEFIDAD